MAKRHLLLVAFLDNIHIYNIVKNVLSEGDFDITAYSLDGPLDCIKESYVTYYQSVGIKIVPGVPLSEGRFRYAIYAFRTLKALGHFDVLNLHFVSHYVSLPIFLLKRLYGKIVLSFWGSDINRTGFLVKATQRPLIAACDKASFTNKDLYQSFIHVHGEKILPPSKVLVIGMGFMFLDSISEIRRQPSFDRGVHKKRFGFNPSSKVVVIGYHGRRAMQQLETVDSIIDVLGERKDEVEVILPGRGMAESARLQISQSLDAAGVRYQILDGFIPDEMMSSFRLCADVFINAQLTDACSASMLEYICAGTVVLNAAWLTYSSLDEKSVYYRTFESFESLGALLADTLDNLETEKAKCADNDRRYDAIPWRQKRAGWLSLYK